MQYNKTNQNQHTTFNNTLASLVPSSYKQYVQYCLDKLTDFCRKNIIEVLETLNKDVSKEDQEVALSFVKALIDTEDGKELDRNYSPSRRIQNSRRRLSMRLERECLNQNFRAFSLIILESTFS